MGKVAERSVKAQENLEILETALDRTQSALRAAERADLVATKTVARSRQLLKLMLVLGVVGVVILVVKKLVGGSSTPPGNPDPYGSSSTEA
ncbi:MAG TPA: hypothetical protein VL068_05755 [Microthrixaceae bacterium]|nr:hypothetical protein [Microthrixaceae bacterium]